MKITNFVGFGEHCEHCEHCTANAQCIMYALYIRVAHFQANVEASHFSLIKPKNKTYLLLHLRSREFLAGIRRNQGNFEGPPQTFRDKDMPCKRGPFSQGILIYCVYFKGLGI